MLLLTLLINFPWMKSSYQVNSTWLPMLLRNSSLFILQILLLAKGIPENGMLSHVTVPAITVSLGSTHQTSATEHCRALSVWVTNVFSPCQCWKKCFADLSAKNVVCRFQSQAVTEWFFPTSTALGADPATRRILNCFTGNCPGRTGRNGTGSPSIMA